MYFPPSTFNLGCFKIGLDKKASSKPQSLNFEIDPNSKKSSNKPNCLFLTFLVSYGLLISGLG